MGYAHKPIPPEIIARWTPEQKLEWYRQERAFLRRVQRRQSGQLNFGGFVLIAVACLFLMLAFGGATFSH